jgi:hypothetical protein
MTTRYLDDADIVRIRAELGDNIVAALANPYIGVRTVYGVIQEYVQTDVVPTSSATTVSTAGPTVLTLASVSGLSVGSRVVIDADDAREVCSVRAVAGLTISVVCRKTHSGTYPVEVENPLTIVRGLLADLETISLRERSLFDSAGVKKVDEIEFFSAAEGGTALASINDARSRARIRLAQSCGVVWIANGEAARAAGGNAFEVF